MKVYFIRHGQTVYNAKGLHQTRDSELSEQGLKQAQFVAKRFKTIAIDIIIASPYPRAAATAKIISEVVKKEIVFNDSLREIKRPTDIEHKLWNHPEVLEIKKQLKDHRDNPNWHYSDEENEYEVKKRIEEFLIELEKRPEENILIATHETIIKMFIALMIFDKQLAIPTYHHIYKRFHLGNTGITVCETREKQWHLVTWNDQAHLG